jgi:hypothetical protein
VTDPQARRVYAMERCEFRGHLAHRVSLKRLRAVARRVCIQLRVPQVRVYLKRQRGVGGEYVCMEGAPSYVNLHPVVGVNYMSLAHELAHHVAWVKAPRSQAHGPTWMWWYAAIMDALRIIPFDGTLAVCRRHGVAIAPVGSVQRPTV